MRGVAYLLIGRSHLVRLLVSLWTLRQHYHGPVELFVPQEKDSLRAAHLVAQEASLDVGVRPINIPIRSNNRAFLAKTLVPKNTPWDQTVYLDADTAVAGNIEELFPQDSELVLCHFAGWHTGQEPLRRRLMKLRYCDMMLDVCLRHEIPGINLGVMGFGRDAPYLKMWHDLSHKNENANLVDEVVMQVLYPSVYFRLVDDRYDCSPVFGVNKESGDVRVWHFHANTSHQTEPGRRLWEPLMRQVWDKNLADVRSWAHTSGDGPARITTRST